MSKRYGSVLEMVEDLSADNPTFVDLFKRELAIPRYLCERCGGMGQQEAGCWNPDSQRYDDPAGICRTCKGEGLLGVIEPSPPPRTQPE
jgi:hypothetical protein